VRVREPALVEAVVPNSILTCLTLPALPVNRLAAIVG